MYSLNYDRVVQALQQFKYSGEVHADLSARAGLKGGGRVILIVQKGIVLSCFIFNQSGQKLHHGTEAQRVLSKLGVLEWRLVPFASPQPMMTESEARTIHISNRNYFYPRRLVLSQVQMRTWSSLQRSVYFLSDGTRSKEQIATLLSRPLSLVEQAIRDLQAFGALER